MTLPAFCKSATRLPDDLVKELKSADAGKQNDAKRKMRSYRFKEVARAMAEFAKDPNPDMRILMAQTLGELGGFESAQSLKKLFAREKDARVRRAIFIQLSGLLPNDAEAFTFFSKVLFSDPNDDIRFLALTQLSLLGRAHITEKEWIKIYRKVWKKDPYSQNKIFAAVALREAGDENPELRAALLQALENPSVEIRRRAALLVGGLKEPALFKRISAAVQDPDFEVRANICRSLGESKEVSAIPLLKSLLIDKEPLVRKNVLEALAVFPSAEVGLGFFAEALQDADPAIRSLAIAILEKEGDVSVIPALAKVAQKDPDPSLRTLAKKAIATISSTSP